MAEIQLRGPSKALAAMSVTKVNATVDSKVAKAAAKPKGMLRLMPPQPVKVQNVPREAPRAVKAKAAADIPRANPPVVKQTIEVDNSKGGKVNKSA